MKKLIIVFVTILLILVGCVKQNNKEEEEVIETVKPYDSVLSEKLAGFSNYQKLIEKTLNKYEVKSIENIAYSVEFWVVMNEWNSVTIDLVNKEDGRLAIVCYLGFSDKNQAPDEFDFSFVSEITNRFAKKPIIENEIVSFIEASDKKYPAKDFFKNWSDEENPIISSKIKDEKGKGNSLYLYIFEDLSGVLEIQVPLRNQDSLHIDDVVFIKDAILNKGHTIVATNLSTSYKVKDRNDLTLSYTFESGTDYDTLTINYFDNIKSQENMLEKIDIKLFTEIISVVCDIEIDEEIIGVMLSDNIYDYYDSIFLMAKYYEKNDEDKLEISYFLTDKMQESLNAKAKIQNGRK